MIDENDPRWQRMAEKAAGHHIPAYMIPGLLRYTLNHIKPGDFLCAILKNDLREACEKADDVNKELLFQYIAFLYNEAPGSCWGSEEKFKSWTGIQDDPTGMGREGIHTFACHKTECKGECK